MARKFSLPPLVEARWVGPYGRLMDGRELAPGQTIIEISPHEAHGSDHWQIVDPRVTAFLEGKDEAPADSTDSEGDA